MKIAKLTLLLLIVISPMIQAAQTSKTKTDALGLSGVWTLNKKENPNPRQNLVEAWKAQRAHKQTSIIYEEGRFIKMMSSFLFPYSDWIKLERYSNGISINYAEGEVREYWTDEKNTPEFTGMIGETTAQWIGNTFVIQTNLKREKMLVKETFSLSGSNSRLVNTIEVQWKKLEEPVLIRQIYERKS